MSNSEQFLYINFFQFLLENNSKKLEDFLFSDKNYAQDFYNNYIFNFTSDNSDDFDKDIAFESLFNQLIIEEDEEEYPNKIFQEEYLKQIYSNYIKEFEENPAYIYYFPFLPILPYDTKFNKFKEFLFENKNIPHNTSKSEKTTNFLNLPYLAMFLNIFNNEVRKLTQNEKIEKFLNISMQNYLLIFYFRISVILLTSKIYCDIIKLLNQIKCLIDKNTWHNLFLKSTLNIFIPYIIKSEKEKLTDIKLPEFYSHFSNNFSDLHLIRDKFYNLISSNLDDITSLYLKLTNKNLMYTLDIPIAHFQVKRSSILIKNQKKLLKLFVDFINLLENLKLPQEKLEELYTRIEELSREKLSLLANRSFIASDSFIKDFKNLMKNIFADEDICKLRLLRKNITYDTIASLIGELLFYKDFPFVNQEKLRKKIIGILNKIHKENEVPSFRKRDFESYYRQLEKSSFSLIPFNITQKTITDEFTLIYFLQLLEELKFYNNFSSELKLSIYNNLSDCINTIKKEKIKKRGEI
ncbi:MAG: hypothetical protein Q4P79_06525 [Fusobacterium sp.]|nr:hypothetical protein [Fusobacterium sp.]MDO5789103.1 hypothetical protein [Fusobacterium sp.]